MMYSFAVIITKLIFMTKISTLFIGIGLCSITLNAQNTWNGTTTSTLSISGSIGLGLSVNTNPLDKIHVKGGNIRLGESYALKWEDALGATKSSIQVNTTGNFSNLSLKADNGIFRHTVISLTNTPIA